MRMIYVCIVTGCIGVVWGGVADALDLPVPVTFCGGVLYGCIAYYFMRKRDKVRVVEITVGHQDKDLNVEVLKYCVVPSRVSFVGADFVPNKGYQIYIVVDGCKSVIAASQTASSGRQALKQLVEQIFGVEK